MAKGHFIGICLVLLLVPAGAAATEPLKVAQSQVGVREQGANCGPEVRQYLAYVGHKCGAPWCAAFVSWCFWKADQKGPRSAWSPTVVGGGIVVKQGVKTLHKVRAGQVFGIYYSNLKRVGHVGFIEKVDGGTITTIEGNTNGGGSREGDGVYRKIRRLSQMHKIVSYEVLDHFATAAP